ncbi:MAG TPA: NAD(P)H-binding protein, partial [Allocoleopsis sp.]
MSDRILVAGATGGVGQLVVANLLEQGTTVRVLTRNPDKAAQMFNQRPEIAVGDICQAETLPAATANVTHIICCTGTTAFPSARWDFDLSQSQGVPDFITWGKLYLDANYRNATARNSPIQVDAIGVSHLVKAAPADLKRFVFISSCGVERKAQFPYSVLNAFGVLDAKQQGEEAIIRSGLPYTII